MTLRLSLSLTVLCTSTISVAAVAAGGASSLVSAGLRNLGNTCYMNAQLECAFHIPLIRDIVRKPEPGESLGIKALRLLFYDMERPQQQGGGAAAATPIALCRTLGIPPLEQQDSQEFWKLLLPALDHSSLMDLYQGSYEDYITALDGSGRERRREEAFLDLSLDVLSARSVLRSLADMFGTPELLSEARDGNGWRPERGAPRVDALKGSLLKAPGLPPLLQLHLKRFQYDWQCETMSKVNGRFAFPAELDLSEIVSCGGSGSSDNDKDDKGDGTTNEDDAVYDLQSVVVHVGEYGSGHYYAYVRPDIRTKDWYRFDDDRVSQVSFRDVVRDAYGGKSAREEAKRLKMKRQQSFLGRLLGGGSRDAYGWGGPKSSAYMLQYVKRSTIPKLYKL